MEEGGVEGYAAGNVGGGEGSVGEAYAGGGAGTGDLEDFGRGEGTHYGILEFFMKVTEIVRNIQDGFTEGFNLYPTSEIHHHVNVA